MSDMIALLPCPFCGEAARFTEQCRDRRWGASVNCDNCGASGGGYYNAASPETADGLALAAWNRRALPPAQPDTPDCPYGEIGDGCCGGFCNMERADDELVKKMHKSAALAAIRAGGGQ